MDHHFKAGARANIDGYEDYYYYGNRPTNGYLARFRNLDKKYELSQRIWISGWRQKKRLGKL